MLDAYGRIPKGVAQGNNMDLGLFDQCINIKENLGNVSIQGKYCHLGLVLPSLKITENNTENNEMVNILLTVLISKLYVWFLQYRLEGN